jgi:hypothetical protein
VFICMFSLLMGRCSEFLTLIFDFNITIFLPFFWNLLPIYLILLSLHIILFLFMVFCSFFFMIILHQGHTILPRIEFCFLHKLFSEMYYSSESSTLCISTARLSHTAVTNDPEI